MYETRANKAVECLEKSGWKMEREETEERNRILHTFLDVGGWVCTLGQTLKYRSRSKLSISLKL